MKHISKIGKKSKRVRKLLQKRVDFDKYLPCLWSDWSKRLVYTMPYIDYGSTVAVCVSHWGLLQHSRAVGGSENLGVPLVMWGHNLPPCWDRVNWCDKNWGHPRHPQGQQACIEAARSPLLYRRSWLLSLGTPEQNFPGLSQMIYDTFTYVKSFVRLYLGEEITITVLWRAPDNESKSSPYHYSS